jgi:two-component system, LytTR family, response regulator
MNSEFLNQKETKLSFKLRFNSRMIEIPIEQIVYLEGDCNYTLVCTKNHKKYVTAKTLKKCEAELDQSFVRIHKSHIINLNYIKMIDLDNKSSEITLELGKQVEVSRRKMKNLSDRMNILLGF